MRNAKESARPCWSAELCIEMEGSEVLQPVCALQGLLHAAEHVWTRALSSSLLTSSTLLSQIISAFLHLTCPTSWCGYCNHTTQLMRWPAAHCCSHRSHTGAGSLSRYWYASQHMTCKLHQHHPHGMMRCAMQFCDRYVCAHYS